MGSERFCSDSMASWDESQDVPAALSVFEEQMPKLRSAFRLRRKYYPDEGKGPSTCNFFTVRVSNANRFVEFQDPDREEEQSAPVPKHLFCICLLILSEISKTSSTEPSIDDGSLWN